MLRQLKLNELIEDGDKCWQERLDKFLMISEDFIGMTAQEAIKKWPVYRFYTDRIKVFRRIEDDEICIQGDTCGPRTEEDATSTRPISTRFVKITLPECFGQTAKKLRKEHGKFDFFTIRPQIEPIFNKPFNLLKNVSLVE